MSELILLIYAQLHRLAHNIKHSINLGDQNFSYRITCQIEQKETQCATSMKHRRGLSHVARDQLGQRNGCYLGYGLQVIRESGLGSKVLGRRHDVNLSGQI